MEYSIKFSFMLDNFDMNSSFICLFFPSRKEAELIDEEKDIDDAVKAAEEFEQSKLQEAKKKKKKILKERKKIHDRLNLKMIIKDDEPIIDEDRELFTLSQIRNRKVIFVVYCQAMKDCCYRLK